MPPKKKAKTTEPTPSSTTTAATRKAVTVTPAATNTPNTRRRKTPIAQQVAEAVAAKKAASTKKVPVTKFSLSSTAGATPTTTTATTTAAGKKKAATTPTTTATTPTKTPKTGKIKVQKNSEKKPGGQKKILNYDDDSEHKRKWTATLSETDKTKLQEAKASLRLFDKSKKLIYSKPLLVQQYLTVSKYYDFRLQNMPKRESAKQALECVPDEFKIKNYRTVIGWAEYYTEHCNFPESMRGCHGKTTTYLDNEQVKTACLEWLENCDDSERGTANFREFVGQCLKDKNLATEDYNISIYTALRWMNALGYKWDEKRKFYVLASVLEAEREKRKRIRPSRPKKANDIGDNDEEDLNNSNINDNSLNIPLNSMIGDGNNTLINNNNHNMMNPNNAQMHNNINMGPNLSRLPYNPNQPHYINNNNFDQGAQYNPNYQNYNQQQHQQYNGNVFYGNPNPQ